VTDDAAMSAQQIDVHTDTDNDALLLLLLLLRLISQLLYG